MIHLKKLLQLIENSWGRDTCHCKFLWGDNEYGYSSRMVDLLKYLK